VNPSAFLKTFFAPQPLARLAFLRILIPLAILGFLSSRLSQPAEWLTTKGFQVPDLGRPDWRQPIYIPPLPLWGAVLVCLATVVSGACLSIGFRTRAAAGAFAGCLVFLALSDRLAAFTVSKLGAVLALALLFTPSGDAWSLDAWRLRRLEGSAADSTDGSAAGAVPPAATSWGNVRFFQVLLVVFYMASGLAKLRGDWLHEHHVLWSHLHDTYQTGASYLILKALPYSAWAVLQVLVLVFETGAPLWFALPLTRYPALWIGFGMHVFIGLCFGPVIWFALLMLILLAGCYAPLPWLERLGDAFGKPPEPLEP